MHAQYYALSGLYTCVLRHPGATRFALAPGYHIPRRWRFMAFTPVPRRWRSVASPFALAAIFRAVGAISSEAEWLRGVGRSLGSGRLAVVRRPVSEGRDG